MKRPRSTAEQGAADKALEEKARLYRHYLASKKATRDALYKEHPCGPDLKTFADQIARYTIADPAPMHTFVCQVARNWLSGAPPEIRAEALSIVSDHITRIRLRAGLPPFDDPLPGDPDNLFLRCKEEMA